MSQEFMAHMFNSFEQENVSESGGGVGLGLSIVKALVTLMGGTIRAESEQGKGSTFIVELDRKLGEPVSQVTLSDLHHTDSLQGKRVLLTEDQPLNTQIVTKLLEKQGMVVETAENGQIAVINSLPPNRDTTMQS